MELMNVWANATGGIETTAILFSTCSAIILGYFVCDFYQRVARYKQIKRLTNACVTPARRLLTATEVCFDRRQRLGDSIDVNAVFIRSVDEAIEEKLLRRALKRVAAKHPMLRSKIVKSSDGVEVDDDDVISEDLLLFEEDDNFHLDLEVLKLDDWLPVCEEEARKKFSPKAPLWRVKLLNSAEEETTLSSASFRVFSNVLIFTFHHAIIDGQSIMRFYDQLLDQLCLCSQTEDEYLPKVTPLSMLPSSIDTFPSNYFHIPSLKLFLMYLRVKLQILLYGRIVTPKSPPPCDFLNLTGRDSLSR